MDFKPHEFIANLITSYNSDKKNTYALQSMAIHSGGLGGGHYYAVCKNYLDDSWYEYNDLNFY